MTKLLICLALLFLCLPIFAQEANCQYREMTIDQVTEPGSFTVIHVRTTRPGEERFFGYDESGIYPWVVEYQWCGTGWTIEFRLGKNCTRWEGDHMERQTTADGKRQQPCDWGDWLNAEFTAGEPGAPNAPVLLAKLEGKK